MGVVQGGQDLAGDVERDFERELAFLIQPCAERFTLDVRHDVVEQRAVVGLERAAVVQREDVGVLQAGGDADFPEEAVAPDGRCQFGPQDLDGHPSLVLQVLRQVHDGHAPAPELALESVAAGQGGLRAAEEVQGVHHGNVRGAGRGARGG